MFRHLPGPNTNTTANVRNIIYSLKPILDELPNEPIKAPDLFKTFCGLSIKGMLEGPRRQCFKWDTLWLGGKSYIGHGGLLLRTPKIAKRIRRKPFYFSDRAERLTRRADMDLRVG